MLSAMRCCERLDRRSDWPLRLGDQRASRRRNGRGCQRGGVTQVPRGGRGRFDSVHRGEVRERMRSGSVEAHHLHASSQGAERPPSGAGVQPHGRIVGITTRAEEAPSRHTLEQAVMQCLSQAPASVCGENCEFDDVEVEPPTH